jgi:hypothetical protein
MRGPELRSGGLNESEPRNESRNKRKAHPRDMISF